MCALGLEDDGREPAGPEHELVRRALFDQLTGMANRYQVMDRLETEIGRIGREPGVAVVLLLVGLDRFKLINNIFGHDAGDRVLCQVADRLAGLAGPDGLAGRLGGDEFLIVAQVPEATLAGPLASRARAMLGRPVQLAGRPVEITASVGAAVATEPGMDPEELVRRAGAALYEAKRPGRSGCELYDQELHSLVLQRHRMEVTLRSALRHDWLRLYYQPIFDVVSGRPVGAEALVRLQHPELGLLGPASFIGVAEDSDLINRIGDWVLRQACAQLAAWDRPSGFHLAVNLSGRELADLAVVRRVLDTLERSGADRRQLVVELTEGVLIDQGPSVVRRLQVLVEAGVQLAIDDFGTGYSSLGYLQKFPVHMLKIDRSFVAGLGVRIPDYVIVQMLAQLAHNLQMSAIAEGVETPGQLATIRSLGCPLAQGYLLSRPVPPEQMTRILDAEQQTGAEIVAAAVLGATQAPNPPIRL
jgi:diguanylate cyclase (GGDEF)-like protein